MSSFSINSRFPMKRAHIDVHTRRSAKFIQMNVVLCAFITWKCIWSLELRSVITCFKYNFVTGILNVTMIFSSDKKGFRFKGSNCFQRAF